VCFLGGGHLPRPRLLVSVFFAHSYTSSPQVFSWVFEHEPPTTSLSIPLPLPNRVSVPRPLPPVAFSPHFDANAIVIPTDRQAPNVGSYGFSFPSDVTSAHGAQPTLFALTSLPFSVVSSISQLFWIPSPPTPFKHQSLRDRKMSPVKPTPPSRIPHQGLPHSFFQSLNRTNTL